MVRVFDLPAGFTVPMVKTDLSATYGEGNVLRVMPEHLRDQDGNKLPVLSSTAVVHLAADTAPASRAKVGGVTVRISDARIRSKTATTPPPAPANAAAAPAPAKTTMASASAAAPASPTDEALAAQLQQQEDEEQRRRDAQQAKDAELARQLHNHEAAADATQPTEEPFTMVTTKKDKKGKKERQTKTETSTKAKEVPPPQPIKSTRATTQQERAAQAKKLREQRAALRIRGKNWASEGDDNDDGDDGDTSEDELLSSSRSA